MKRNDKRNVRDIFTHNGYKKILKSPTRITRTSATLIDVILTNNQQNISHVETIPSALSDHDLTACIRKMNNIKYILCLTLSVISNKFVHSSLQWQKNRWKLLSPLTNNDWRLKKRKVNFTQHQFSFEQWLKKLSWNTLKIWNVNLLQDLMVFLPLSWHMWLTVPSKLVPSSQFK